MRDGKITHYRTGRALTVQPSYNSNIDRRLSRYYDEAYGLSPTCSKCRSRRTVLTMPSRRSHVWDNAQRRAIDDSFAEAFPMRGTALLITGHRKWARQAAMTMTGFATSVIACGCEAGIDGDRPRILRTGGRACACCCSPSPPPNCKISSEPRRPMRADDPGSACYSGLEAATN